MASADVLVIGAGPGGYVAAIRLARLGKKVTLVEKHKLGGECLNYGCIPSKALIAAANVLSKARKAKEWGLDASDWRQDMEKLQGWKTNLVGNLNRGIAGLLKGNGVVVLQGEAKFIGPWQALVQSGGKDISFEQAIIATGSEPMEIPGFHVDGERVIGSQGALDLRELPKSMLVIGGGVIGLEIGTFYAKLGTKVIVVEMMGQLLPGIDNEFVIPVARSLEKMGVQVYLNAQASGYEAIGSQAQVVLKTSDAPVSIRVEKILLCVGRRPNSRNLGLDSVGVQTDAKGFIKTDEFGRTSAPGIYAIGDVTQGPLLAHRSSAQGLALARR